MPNITLTVASVVPPAGGKKRGTLKGVCGTTLGVFAEKLAQFQFVPGKTYAIDYNEVEYQGSKLRNVVSATIEPDVKPGSLPALQQQPLPPLQAAPPQPEYNRQTSPADSERMWVCATLTALIRAGEVKNDKEQIWHTVTMLRNVYKFQFGEGATGFLASQAGQPARLQQQAMAH